MSERATEWEWMNENTANRMKNGFLAHFPSESNFMTVVVEKQSNNLIFNRTKYGAVLFLPLVDIRRIKHRK